jgi:DNA-binding response OmpR family regulator
VSSVAARGLVLEDDPTIRELIEAVFEDEGFETRRCASPEEAVKLVGESASTLLVADFWGASHTDLASDEREQIVRLAETVPTILVTGRTWAGRLEAADLGLVALVRKPFDIDELQGCVAGWINHLATDSTAARSHARDLQRREAARAELVRVASRCSHCQRRQRRLYRPPPGMRTGSVAPSALCHFCFLRLAGRRPTRLDLLPADDSARP